MKRAVVMLLFLATVAAGEVRLSGHRKFRTIDCAKDPVVVIDGDHNRITLKGRCTRIGIIGSRNSVAAEAGYLVELDGDDNRFAIEAVELVAINGSRNRLTWSSTFDGTTEPDRSVRGRGNRISRKLD